MITRRVSFKVDASFERDSVLVADLPRMADNIAKLIHERLALTTPANVAVAWEVLK